MLSSLLGQRRRAGILLHPTSLPGSSLGAVARAYVDWLARAGVGVWQTLPLSPRDRHGSPYAAESAYAGDITLLDGELLRDDGLLAPEEQLEFDADKVIASREQRLLGLWQRLEAAGSHPLQKEFQAFRAHEAFWLEDYALFRCLRREQSRPWHEWPQDLRLRHRAELEHARRRHAQALSALCLGQFLFQRQWQLLRSYAHQRGVLLFGDLPFFVAHDSADVWGRPELFQLEADGTLSVDTGVPPDYFSKDGQLWHMPHYAWDAMQADGYAWWLQRMRRQSQLFDILRIDHFRGMAAAWEVPAEAPTALTGRWAPGPGLELLQRLQSEIKELALAAEDLGYITDDVRDLRERAGIPGMRVFQFGFDGDAANPHLPRNCPLDAVMYSGTHDNDTLMGWYAGLDEHTRCLVREAVGIVDDEALCEGVKRSVLDAEAILAIVPMQDVLCLDSSARMNTPGRPEGNWQWRLSQLPTDAQADSLRALLVQSGRC